MPQDQHAMPVCRLKLPFRQRGRFVPSSGPVWRNEPSRNRSESDLIKPNQGILDFRIEMVSGGPSPSQSHRVAPNPTNLVVGRSCVFAQILGRRSNAALPSPFDFRGYHPTWSRPNAPNPRKSNQFMWLGLPSTGRTCGFRRFLPVSAALDEGEGSGSQFTLSRTKSNQLARLGSVWLGQSSAKTRESSAWLGLEQVGGVVECRISNSGLRTKRSLIRHSKLAIRNSARDPSCDLVF